MENKSRKILTLSIIHQPPRVLLGLKKRGFGAGRWNGFGGKVKENESIQDAAKRELLEEAGITADDLEEIGLVDFEFVKNPAEILEVHIFKVRNFTGTPKESEEMEPRWFNLDEIPFTKMWSDDVCWFPLFLTDRKFKGRFLFDESDQVLEKKLSEINSI